MYVYVCVCVCVRERVKEIEKERHREERKIETDRKSSIARVVPTGHRPIDCMQVYFSHNYCEP